MGPAQDSVNVVTALQAEGNGAISLVDRKHAPAQSRVSQTGSERSKIAIVGMSGRFPGGADVEKFWDILQKGFDMHKEVRRNPAGVRPSLLTWSSDSSG